MLRGGRPQNNRGKPITFRGETMTRAEWARRLGITPQALTMRLQSGESLETALTEGPRTQGGRPPEHGGTGSDIYVWWKELHRCAGWSDFERFMADIGLRPTKRHVLRRIDYDRGWDCGTCDDCRARGAAANARWVHISEMPAGTLGGRGLITFGGITDSPAGWANRLGISRTRMSERLALCRDPGSGWTLERALTERGRQSR